MVNFDYIVVGCGLASIAFCEQLKAHNKSFIVFDDKSQQSSIVAAGLYNPVVLKRFSKVWLAKEQLELAIPMYAKIERELNIKIDFQLQILRRFISIEEQNKWFESLDKVGLENYMSNKIIFNDNDNINAIFGFGEVLKAGRVDTEVLISSYRKALKNTDLLREISFDYNNMQIINETVIYNHITAKHIVFAEGFGVKKNPFFKDIPLNGTKGELITIFAPNLKIQFAIKSSVFVIPLGNDLYNIGSTYDNDDKSNTPTQKGKNELLSKLVTFINCDFEVIKHVAGVRPTVRDRRPLVGRHSEYKNMYILNGLGTRGVMIAPYVAEKLFQHIENNTPLNNEIDIMRFKK